MADKGRRENMGALFGRWLLPGESPAAIAGVAVSLLVMIASLITAHLMAGSWLPIALGALGLLGLLASLLLIRKHLLAPALLRKALADLEGDDLEAEALRLGETFGREAQNWNRLLDDYQALRSGKVVEEAKLQTDRRQAAGGSLRAACEAIESGMILINDELRVTYANGAAAAFLQKDAEGCAGTPLAELITDQGVLDAASRATRSKGYSRGIVEVDQREQGGSGVLRFITRPSRRSDNEAAIVIIEDITQQRVAQEAHSAFLAQAAHELRTPLTNIRLHIDTAIEHGDKDPQTRDECLNVINSESGRLERVVQDMLSVSEIEAGAMSLRRDDVHLEKILQQVEKDHRPQAEARKQTLRFDLPPRLPNLTGDQDKILMAIHNLVGNAIKYTPEAGNVTLEADVADGKLSIRVIDTGIGISEENLPRIFDRFFRTEDARTKGITGTGLGLGLARDIARLHGGDITVSSITGEGSTFTLCLPATVGSAVVG